MKPISLYIRSILSLNARYFVFRGNQYRIAHFDQHAFEELVVEMPVPRGWETLKCETQNKISTTMLAHWELTEYALCWN